MIRTAEEGASVLNRGGLLAIPTETVYGLAANAFDEAAVARIFKAKGRPSYDPLILHIARAAALEQLVRIVYPEARMLAEEFWPGPLTLVLPKKEIVPDLVTAGLDTVAIRMPDHPLTLELLGKIDFPVAAPSANPFGYVSPTSAAHVAEQLGERIDAILDGGTTRVGLESTIIGFPGGRPTLYRYGGLESERIESLIGPLDYVLSSSSDPLAPGMLEKHYSPSKKVLLGDPAALAAQLEAPFAILSFRSGFEAAAALEVFTLSARGDLHEAAHRLFMGLRRLDALPVKYILAELLPEEGLGRAINDRLRRAAARR